MGPLYLTWLHAFHNFILFFTHIHMGQLHLTWFNAGVQCERDNVLLWQQCDVNVASAESLDEKRLALVGRVQH